MNIRTVKVIEALSHPLIEYAAVPPFVFYACLLLFRNNRKTSFLEEKTGCNRPSSNIIQEDSIHQVFREKKHHGEWSTVFLGKVEGTLADVERI